MTGMRAALVDELHALRASWAYAFACGDPCAVPSTPEGRAVLTRADRLQARIEELTP